MLSAFVIAFLCVREFTLTAAFVPSVTYVSFLSSTTSDQELPNATRSDIIITSSDDSPVVEVELASIFPYFGVFIDRIFVSPNGFVQTSAAAIISPSYGSPCSVTFDGAIAGYLADLTAFTVHNSSVSVVQNKDVTSVRYRGLNVWGYSNTSDPRLDFNINLYSDGTTSIEYEDIVPLGNIVPSFKQCDWLTGLVTSSDTISSGRGVVTTDQLSIQKYVWDTKGKGVYPALHSNVTSGTRFVACPLSTSWCASPSLLRSTTTHLNITALSLGCVLRNFDVNSTIDIAIQLDNSSFPPVVVNASLVSSCAPIVAAGRNTTTSAPVGFECDLTGISLSSYFSTGLIYMHILWKPSRHGHAEYTSVGDTVFPVPLQFNSTTPGDTDVVMCALNQEMGECAACEVCNSYRNYTEEVLSCLSLSCPPPTAADYITNASLLSFSTSPVLQSLYTTPSCSRRCERSFTEQLANHDVCCEVSEIDCIGDCHGGALEGVDPDDGHTICCRASQPPDCFGVCGGPAMIDTCNVCNGNDTGILCPTGFTVDTGSNVLNSDHHLTTLYDAINASHVSVVPVTVYNSFNTSVFVTISLSTVSHDNTNQAFGPGFWFSGETYEVEGNQNFTFDISSNMSGVFTGTLSGWEVKTLALK